MIQTLLLASVAEASGVALFAGIFGVAIVAIVAEALQKSAKVRQREQSRREIAAYVAEGSITAEDGAKLIAAGETLKDKIGIKV